MGEKIDLVEPSMLLKDPFLEMAGEFREAGEYYPHHEEAQQNFGLFIDGLFDKALGIGLPPGYVPGTTFWLVRDGVTLLGTCGAALEGGEHALDQAVLVHEDVDSGAHGTSLGLLVSWSSRSFGLFGRSPNPDPPTPIP